jgi:hypothetical protein
MLSSAQLQGCQIFLATTYQNGKNIPNYHKISKIPNGHKIYRVAVKQIKCPRIDHQLQLQDLKKLPKFGLKIL